MTVTAVISGFIPPVDQDTNTAETPCPIWRYQERLDTVLQCKTQRSDFPKMRDRTSPSVDVSFRPNTPCTTLLMGTDLCSILDRLTPVLRDVFDNDDLVATPELTASMVSGWDSLSNVRLFVEVERVFNIRFTTPEIASLGNVGQLAALIKQKANRIRP